MTTEFKAARCDAIVFVRDDRLGGIDMRCESEPDHDGPHSHAMTACEPRAELTWWTEEVS